MSLLQQVQDGPKAPKPKKKKNDLRPEDLLDIVLNKLKTEREEQVAEAKDETESEEEEVPVEAANSEPEPVKPAQPKPAKPVIEQVTVPIPPASAPGINTEVPVSSTPLEDLLKSMLITNSSKHPTKWVFTIKRNASGFIESIEANAK